MAKFRRRIRMLKETARKQRYLQHYKKAGAKALTYAQFIKSGEQPTYFKGAGFRRKSVEARLREAGITGKRISRLKRKKL